MNKRGDVVTTAVTNMDIHDISRVSRTYGAYRFYIVTPITRQRDLTRKIIRHWREGYGASFNPSRNEAFRTVEVKESLDEVLEDVVGKGGVKTNVVATSASNSGRTIEYDTLKKHIELKRENFVLLFGTGWGLSSEILTRSDFVLAPIQGPTDFNHLSVRSAVGITMDRLMGQRN